MTIFPNAKINIGLWITSRRADGFHDIETIFYPIGIKDACEFVIQDDGIDSDEFTGSGIDTGCLMSDNLVIKAVNLVRSRFNIPALRIHLHKAIPLGAGLGGGSSDAAFVLRYLNRYFRLGLCIKELHNMAASLGSDCPFFIQNIPSYALGKGEKLTKIDVRLKGYNIIIVKPGININTAEAYSSVLPKKRDVSLLSLYELAIEEWRENIVNDFEPVIFDKFPEIGEIKNELYRQGALFSSMSGSGSSVYGIFRSAPPQDIFSKYWTWSGTM